MLLAAASRLLPLERWSCFAASPQTLRRWHRVLLQGNRRRRARPPGRPPLAASTRSLILRLARENRSLGLCAHPGRAAKARDQRFGHHDRNRIARLGPRAGAAPDRPYLVGVSARPSAELARRRSPLRARSRLRGQRGGAQRTISGSGDLNLEAEKHSSDATEEPWSPLPVPGLARLSAVAAVPSPCDSTAAPLHSCARWTKDTPTLLARADGSDGLSKPSTARAWRASCNHSSGSPRRADASFHQPPRTTGPRLVRAAN